MKHLKIFESFGDKPYWKIGVDEFSRDDKSELFQSTEVAKIIELLKGLGYDVELENIFCNPVETLNKVYKIKGKKTSPLAKGDIYYKDDIVLYKLEDEYFDVYFAKITEIGEQTRSERLKGCKAIPIHNMTYYKVDQLDGLEELFNDIL
jgi:hypothetical protein